MNRILCILLSLCLLFFSAPVWAGERVLERPGAESASPGLSPSALFAAMDEVNGESLRDPAEPPSFAEEELESRLRALRLQRDAVNVQSPRKARLAGGIMLGVGAGIAALAAITCAAANSGSGTECREDNATALEIGGGAVAGIGLITLIAGISTLGKREEEVREFDRQIKSLNLKRSRGASNIDARLSLGKDKKLILSWRF